jgi:hypothetical protein
MSSSQQSLPQAPDLKAEIEATMNALKELKLRQSGDKEAKGAGKGCSSTRAE